MAGLFDDAPIIYAYTAEDALADGFLVPVSEVAAREAGFTIPVVMTRGAWDDCVAWQEGPEGNVEDAKPATGQDEAGRLWDVLWLASNAARRNPAEDLVTFTVHRVPASGRGVLPRPVTLWVHVGPGDDGSPIITIMRPEDY